MSWPYNPSEYTPYNPQQAGTTMYHHPFSAPTTPFTATQVQSSNHAGIPSMSLTAPTSPFIHDNGLFRYPPRNSTETPANMLHSPAVTNSGGTPVGCGAGGEYFQIPMGPPTHRPSFRTPIQHGNNQQLCALPDQFGSHQMQKVRAPSMMHPTGALPTQMNFQPMGNFRQTDMTQLMGDPFALEPPSLGMESPRTILAPYPTMRALSSQSHQGSQGQVHPGAPTLDANSTRAPNLHQESLGPTGNARPSYNPQYRDDKEGTKRKRAPTSQPTPRKKNKVSSSNNRGPVLGSFSPPPSHQAPTTPASQPQRSVPSQPSSYRSETPDYTPTVNKDHSQLTMNTYYPRSVTPQFGLSEVHSYTPTHIMDISPPITYDDFHAWTVSLDVYGLETAKPGHGAVAKLCRTIPMEGLLEWTEGENGALEVDSYLEWGSGEDGALEVRGVEEAMPAVEDMIRREARAKMIWRRVLALEQQVITSWEEEIKQVEMENARLAEIENDRQAEMENAGQAEMENSRLIERENARRRGLETAVMSSNEIDRMRMEEARLGDVETEDDDRAAAELGQMLVDAIRAAEEQGA